MADFLAVPVERVKKRLHDARKRLRTQLESVAVAEVPREWRPSSSPRLETQVAKLTALLDSVARGDLAAVKAMLDAHPQYLSARGALPRFSVVSATAMTMAALCGRADVVELLLSRGADPGSSSGGASAIALAAIEGRSNVVKLLIVMAFSRTSSPRRRSAIVRACANSWKRTPRSPRKRWLTAARRCTSRGASTPPRCCLTRAQTSTPRMSAD